MVFTITMTTNNNTKIFIDTYHTKFQESESGSIFYLFSNNKSTLVGEILSL